MSKSLLLLLPSKLSFPSRVPYLALARAFQLIEETSGRLRMIEILSNLFRSVIVLSPNDLLPCVYLSLNQLAPAYEGLELGVAETNLMKAIAQSTGRTMSQIKVGNRHQVFKISSKQSRLFLLG